MIIIRIESEVNREKPSNNCPCNSTSKWQKQQNKNTIQHILMQLEVVNIESEIGN